MARRGAKKWSSQRMREHQENKQQQSIARKRKEHESAVPELYRVNYAEHLEQSQADEADLYIDAKSLSEENGIFLNLSPVKDGSKRYYKLKSDYYRVVDGFLVLPKQLNKQARAVKFDCKMIKTFACFKMRSFYGTDLSEAW